MEDIRRLYADDAAPLPRPPPVDRLDSAIASYQDYLDARNIAAEDVLADIRDLADSDDDDDDAPQLSSDDSEEEEAVITQRAAYTPQRNVVQHHQDVPIAIRSTVRRLSSNDDERLAYDASSKSITYEVICAKVKSEMWWKAREAECAESHALLVKVCKFCLAPQALGRGEEGNGRPLSVKYLEGVLELTVQFVHWSDAVRHAKMNGVRPENYGTKAVHLFDIPASIEARFRLYPLVTAYLDFPNELVGNVEPARASSTANRMMSFQLVAKCLCSSEDVVFLNTPLQRRFHSDLQIVLAKKAAYASSFRRRELLYKKIAPFPTLILVGKQITDSVTAKVQEEVASRAPNESPSAGIIAEVTESLAMGFLILGSATMRRKAISGMYIGPEKDRNFRPVYTDAEQKHVDHFKCDYDYTMLKSKGRYPPPVSFHASLTWITTMYLTEFRPAQTCTAPHLASNGPLLLQGNLKPISPEWFRRVWKKLVIPHLDASHSAMTPHGVRHSQTIWAAGNSTTAEKNVAWGQNHEYKASKLYYNLRDASGIAEAANAQALNSVFSETHVEPRAKRPISGPTPPFIFRHGSDHDVSKTGFGNPGSVNQASSQDGSYRVSDPASTLPPPPPPRTPLSAVMSPFSPTWEQADILGVRAPVREEFREHADAFRQKYRDALTARPLIAPVDFWSSSSSSISHRLPARTPPFEPPHASASAKVPQSAVTHDDTASGNYIGTLDCSIEFDSAPNEVTQHTRQKPHLSASAATWAAGFTTAKPTVSLPTDVQGHKVAVNDLPLECPHCDRSITSPQALLSHVRACTRKITRYQNSVRLDEPVCSTCFQVFRGGVGRLHQHWRARPECAPLSSSSQLDGPSAAFLAILDR